MKNPNHLLNSPSRMPGFTLIEMLVVIAIIALLVSLIVPSVSRALASAQSAKCTSNMRQIGLAILAYTQDHDGVLPPTGFYGVSPHYNRDPRNFPNMLRDYLGLRESTTWSTSASQTEFAAIFACPSFPGPRGEKCYGLTDRLEDEWGNTVRPWGFMTNAQGGLNPRPMRLDLLPPNEIAMIDRDWQGKVSHQRHRNALRFDFSVTQVPLDY